MIRTESPLEQGFLVGVELKRETSLWRVEDSLEELGQLDHTAGTEVLVRLVHRSRACR